MTGGTGLQCALLQLILRNCFHAREWSLFQGRLQIEAGLLPIEGGPHHS